MFKRENSSRSLQKKVLLPVITLVVILAISSRGSHAWLNAHTDSVVNLFASAEVNVEIHEEFDGYIKKNLYIRNNGMTDAYIRVALIPYWEDEAGKPVGIPATLKDFSINWGIGWITAGNDGFYYYTEPVAPSDATSVLIEQAEVVTSNNGCRLNLQVIADAIQAEPENAVTTTWDVTVVSGRIDGNPIA